MQAEIEGEDDDYVKIYVTDNGDTDHDLTVEKDTGEIVYHEQDGYADKPAGRTREETEYGSQARRFAKWHVYRERGYDTVPPTENPDRLAAALLALTTLSDGRFESYFGDIEDRLHQHYDGPSVELPFPDADPDDAIVYQKDVYLTPDPIDFDPPVLDQFLARFEGEPDSLVSEGIRSITPEAMDDLAFEVEGVSEMHVVHNDGQGTEQVARGDQPLDRDPDARIELMAFDPSSVDSFQHYLVSHLAYQIRDRFLLMGIEPPVAFRAQGWGTYEGFQCQKFCSLYDEYWSSSAVVDSWTPGTA